MCSSLDGQKYCSCEYNQRCSSTERACSCSLYESRPPVPVIQSRPAKTLDQGSEPSPNRRPLQELPNRHELKSSVPVDDNRSDGRPAQETIHDPIPPAPADDSRSARRPVQELIQAGGLPFQMPRQQTGVDTKLPADDRRSATDFVKLAQTAIIQGRIHDALDLIERGQTRLLDRSVALNQTFDPIKDAPIERLSVARQALVDRDRAAALGALGSALAEMR